MFTEDKQILDIVTSIKTIKNSLNSADNLDIPLITDLHDAIAEINQFVYGNKIITLNNALQAANQVLQGEESIVSLLKEVDDWCCLISDVIFRRSKLGNNIDRDFYKVMDHLEATNYNSLLSELKEILNEIKNSNESLYQNFKDYYTYFKDFWGALDIESGNYDVLEQRIKALKEHREDFIWLYERLGDYRSKIVLSGIIQNWITFNPSLLSNIKEYNFDDYYDLDLIKCNENEVFVDIGAYTGDSALSFIQTYGKYKKVYCYEITQDSLEKCKSTLSAFDNIDIRNKGVGSKNEVKYFQKFGVDGSSNKLNTQGEIPINIVSIDNDITEKITFIKMDVEGAEQDALKGCRRHIIEDHPKLALCTYHNNEDIWKIPRLIEEMDSTYNFYMRYNGKQLGPTEYVFFAL